MYTVRYNDGYLAHYGKGHLDGGHSGRYPWGSGKEPGTDTGGKTGKLVKFGHKGQRKIGASLEERTARGEALTKQGSSNAKAILSYFGRETLHSVASVPASLVTGSIMGVGIATANPVIYGVGLATTYATAGAITVMGVNNVIRTYQDIVDMGTYKDAQARKRSSEG